MPGVRSVTNVPATKAPLSPLARVRALAARARPYSRAGTTYGEAVVPPSGSTHADVVWYSSLWPWLAVPPAPGTHSVVDLFDLQDVLLERRSALRRGGDTVGGHTRRVSRRIWEYREISQLRQAQQHLLGSSDTVFVASEGDRARLGQDAAVLPNGISMPPRVDGQRATRAEDDSGGLGLFVGFLPWWPNRDATRFFAKQVLPLVRRAHPDFGFRVVGRRTAGLDDVEAISGVELAGFAPDLAAEYDRADLVVVPLRAGSGTRIKILEAFAHQVPVVSTSIGAEGLDVTSGTHLLLADTAEEFAAAIGRLQADPDLGRRLSGQAFDLVSETYDWEQIEGVVASTVEALADHS